jgi:cation diffusion facilitator family transporter
MTLQKKATVVASIIAGLLAVTKLIVGIISGSVAVLASAVDSVLDLVISIFNYFAVNNSEKPADSRFNYGRGKIEALASVIEGTVITLSGLFLLYQAVEKVFTQSGISSIDISIYVMIGSMIATFGLVLYLNYVAKKTNSMVVRADALHYKTDLYTNLAVLVSLVAINYSGIVIIDSIIGGAIAIYIIYSAYELIKDGVLMLLDEALDEEIVQEIEKLAVSEKVVTDFHNLRTRTSGNVNFVDIHLVFTPNISLLDAHRASDRIEEKIKSLNKSIEWSLNMHLDPYDDSDINH